MEESFDRTEYHKRITKERLSRIETSEDNSEFIIFEEPKERQEIAVIGQKMAEYIHSNDIRDVVFLDRTFRPGYVALWESWKILFPNEPLPNVYFMNPRGFWTKEAVAQNPDLLKRDEFTEPYFTDTTPTETERLSDAQIQDEIRKRYHKLFEEDGTTVLLMDACYHSGDSMEPVVKLLKGMNLNVKKGVVASSNSYAEPERQKDMGLDLEIFSTTPYNMCHPFDYDWIVAKTTTKPYSRPRVDPTQLTISKQIRKEIKMAVRDYVKSSS